MFAGTLTVGGGGSVVVVGTIVQPDVVLTGTVTDDVLTAIGLSVSVTVTVVIDDCVAVTVEIIVLVIVAGIEAELFVDSDPVVKEFELQFIPVNEIDRINNIRKIDLILHRGITIILPPKP